mgnify:CR=1 FL=1
MSADSKKTKALDLAINQIDRQFGKGAIMRMGDDHISMSDNVISFPIQKIGSTCYHSELLSLD